MNNEEIKALLRDLAAKADAEGSSGKVKIRFDRPEEKEDAPKERTAPAKNKKTASDAKKPEEEVSREEMPDDRKAKNDVFSGKPNRRGQIRLRLNRR